jgi:Flp pilus assembly protein TadG
MFIQTLGSIMKDLIERLAKDRHGNFGMMTAILMPVLIGSAGVAIDFSSMLLSKQNLQNYSDGAALAASSALADDDITEAQAKALASDYFKGQMAVDGVNAIPTVSVATVSGPNNSKTYTVDVSYSYNLKLSPAHERLQQDVSEHPRQQPIDIGAWGQQFAIDVSCA